MSVIVAVRKNRRICVASDSDHFFGSRREPADNLVRCPKIRKIGDCVIGSVGASIYETFLEEYFDGKHIENQFDSERTILRLFVDFWKFIEREFHLVNCQSGSNSESQLATLDAQFLIATRTDLFTVDEDLTVMRFRSYCSIGSGARYALGAVQALLPLDFDAVQVATRAVEVASCFDEATGGAIQQIELETEAT